MALTLAESAKLATDMMLAGVIETIVKEEHILDQLPFVDTSATHFGCDLQTADDSVGHHERETYQTTQRSCCPRQRT